MRSFFPASVPHDFCLISLSIVIGCFKKTFCLVKYTVLQGKTWHVGKLFFSCPLLQTKEQYLKNKFLIMQFLIIFLKVTIVTISIYAVEARLRYNFFRIKWAKIILKMINLFPIAGVKHLIVTHVRNALDAWIPFCKTWMTSKNCYYKNLLKS